MCILFRHMYDIHTLISHNISVVSLQWHLSRRGKSQALSEQSVLDAHVLKARQMGFGCPSLDPFWLDLTTVYQEHPRRPAVSEML